MSGVAGADWELEKIDAEKCKGSSCTINVGDRFIIENYLL